ncbi:MAG TPA: CHAD domain-containing protein [Xanthobacteraceae bacterium]|jgi:CHAD domain-containing protein
MDSTVAQTFGTNWTAAGALQRIARNSLAQAHTAISDADKPENEAVHDFRRAMKRWRALLRLIGPIVGAEARVLRDEARDLARALAGARDPQSALDALADIEKHGCALSAGSMAHLRERVHAIRTQAETRLDAGLRRSFSAALDRASMALELWLLDAITSADIAHQLARGYDGARSLIPADWQAATADELHELRKRVVIHRYQIEIAEESWPRFVKMWAGEAQRLRERLGKHHDLVVLETLTAPHQPLARWRSRLVPAVKARQAAHVAAAARLAARLFHEKPKAFERRLVALSATESPEHADYDTAAVHQLH